MSDNTQVLSLVFYFKEINMKITDYETRTGKSRHIEVKINCEQCGKEKWVRWIRVKNGQGRFCGLKCANLAQRKWGKENVYFHFSPTHGRYMARWRDEDDNVHVTTKARFLYEQEYGEIERGYEVHHKDGNKCNDDLSNLKLISISEHRKMVHGSSRKVIDGIVYKQCFSCKEYFPENSYKHRAYCKPCYAEYMREYRKNRK